METLSGGQRRRLDLALAIVGDPELLFLDEPTTGFDPSARRRSWELIDGLRSLDKTILLTTHYMEEAQQLADRVAVIASGRVVAEGPPATLAGRELRQPPSSTSDFPTRSPLEELPLPAGVDLERVNGRVSFRTPAPTRDLAPLIAWASERDRELEGLTVTRPSLEDVYLELTERKDRDGTSNGARPSSRSLAAATLDRRANATDPALAARGRSSRSSSRSSCSSCSTPPPATAASASPGARSTSRSTSRRRSGSTRLAVACYATPIFSLAAARELGLLKRVRGTPLSPGVYLSAWLAGAILIGLAAVALMFVVAVPAFGVDIYPRLLPAAVVTAARRAPPASRRSASRSRPSSAEPTRRRRSRT